MSIRNDRETERQLAALGANIRAARKRAHATQEQLSISANVSRAAVSMLEKGLRSPDLYTLTRISRALGLQPADLLTAKGRATPPHKPKAAAAIGPERRFGENLRRARYRAGLSQSALGSQAEVDVMAVSMYERGLRNPNIRTVLRLARALRVTPAELLRDITATRPLSPNEPADRRSDVCQELNPPI